MRWIFYVLGEVFIALALGVFAWDVFTYFNGEDPFAFRELGTIWASIDRESLLLLEPAIVRHVSPWLWESVVFPLLQSPATFVFGGFGLVFLMIGALLTPKR